MQKMKWGKKNIWLYCNVVFAYDGVFIALFRELRDSLEQMKIQIDTLSSDKRSATTEFRVQEMAHKKYISERREEAKLKRKEEKEAAEAQKMKEWWVE